MKKKFILFLLLIYSNYYCLNASSIKAKMEDAYSAIYNSASMLPEKQSKIIKEKVSNEYEKHTKIYKNPNKSSITVFYFVDSGITDTAIERFSIAINKIGVTGKVMYRGLINNSFQESANLVKNIQTEKEIKNIDFYPIHFHSFNKFKLEAVPAYALSICNNEQFRFADCKHKYLIKGDISLASFFEKIKEYGKEYEEYYYALLEGTKENETNNN